MSTKAEELARAREEMGLNDETQSIIDPPKEDKKDDGIIDLTPDEEETKIKEEDEVEEEENKTSPQVKGVPYKEFNRIRTQAREDKEKRLAAEAELAELKAKHEDAVASKSVEEEIRASALELVPEGADEATIKATENQLRVIAKLTGKNAQVKEVNELKEKLALMEDEKIFNSEWDGFSSELKGMYSGATRAQLQEARDAMDELSHSPQFADKEFDYVYFKNKDIFNDIFVQKSNKSFDSKDTYVPREENNDIDESTSAYKMSPDKLMKRVAQRRAQAAQEDNESGWNIENNEM